MTFHVAGVTTTDGKDYENVDLKGITAEQWSSNALDLTLVNPAGSLVETVASTGGFTPSAVTVDGHAVGAASSLSAYDGATSSSWFFDSATRTLHVKATQGAATGTDLRVSFTGSTDTQPPSTPGNLQQTGSTTTSVSLSWNASNDNVGVSHYDVKLDGQLAASPTGTSTTITGLTCGTSHSITVVAVDGVGNTSSPASLTAATAQCPPTTTLTPVADAYVDASSASTNFGSSTKLRVDSSPDVRSYLRFDLTGISGVTSATLRVFATSALTAGYDVHGVSDTSWGESTLNYGNAPAFDPAVAGSSGAVVASSYTSVDVTSAVHGGGLISLALIAKSATALGLDSRESGVTTTPQLIVTTAGERRYTGAVRSDQPPLDRRDDHDGFACVDGVDRQRRSRSLHRRRRRKRGGSAVLDDVHRRRARLRHRPHVRCASGGRCRQHVCSDGNDRRLDLGVPGRHPAPVGADPTPGDRNDADLDLPRVDCIHGRCRRRRLPGLRRIDARRLSDEHECRNHRAHVWHASFVHRRRVRRSGQRLVAVRGAASLDGRVRRRDDTHVHAR